VSRHLWTVEDNCSWHFNNRYYTLLL